VVVAPVSDMRDDIKVMKLLKVPHGYKIITPVAIGYPDESPNPRPRLSLDEIVFYEEFGKRRKK
jgi:nitroreductase